MNNLFKENLKCELLEQSQCQDQPKDILVVVYNQLDYIRNCVESVYANTSNFELYVWNNASDTKTTAYLESLVDRPHFHLYSSKENLGFLEPNNKLAEISKSPYIILLNSDTEVYEGWDKCMLGHLQHNNTAAVGYMGGFLDESGLGGQIGFGNRIDYLMGWCLCFSRGVFEKYGLFDGETFRFAYFEDADFSLRLLEANKNIHALHAQYVFHHGNATAKTINTGRMSEIFAANHLAFAKKWSNYLTNKRRLLPPKESGQPSPKSTKKRAKRALVRPRFMLY